MTDNLRKLHVLMGIAFLMLFLATGQMMGFHDPPVPQLPMAERMMFRSRHLYLLFIALINLLVALRYALPAAGGRRMAAVAGSVLTLIAGILLYSITTASRGTP